VSFVEALFPDCLSFGSVGGPGYATDIVELSSGHEQRNQRWSRERHRYDLSMTVRNQQERDEITAFFRRMKGRTYGWRIKDWADHSGTGEYIATVTAGDPGFYYLRKAYTVGAETEFRWISKPRAGVVLTANGAPMDPSAYAVDLTTGRVDIVGAIALGTILRATFEFDVPVRFDTDTLRWDVVDKSGGEYLYKPDNLPVVELMVTAPVLPSPPPET
jgi:uncharacterized protein (TIGR02217 family)